MTKHERRELLRLLRAVRRFVSEEEKHARRCLREDKLGVYRGALTSRHAVDLAHADLMDFKAKDVLRLLNALRRAP